MVKLKNNTITSYQVIKPEMVRGAKAGSKPSKPNIADDTVSSLSLAKVLYGLSEGEISGIVGDAKGISLEDTPLEDAEGNKNFENVTYDFRSGTLEQEYIKGFPDVSNEIPVSVELKSTTPWIKAINKTDLSAIRIRLAWNGLKKQDLGSGDVSGYKIEYAIDIKTGSGAYTQVLKTFINDKVSGKYERTHRIDLPESTNGWQVRVRRLTANANSELIVDKMYIESITEVMDVKLRYPNTALLGLQYDAKTFSRIAKISVRAKGKIISIPSNYDTNTGLYTGLWNGTFKQAYSDNPAWIFYDILTATRYGLGKNIDKSMVNKWSIYNLGVYCDELIDDGTGNNTKEKRYSCNVYLQTQQEAFKVLQQLAGIFKAITYWNGEQIVLDADVPQDPVYTFSRSNIIGEPDYSGTAFKDRHTVAKVAFDNPEEGYKTEYEYIRDEAGIAKYGINIVDISAIGCTSRGQAQRAGLWALKSELLETRTVSFQTGLEGFIPQVGNVIELSDGLLAGRDNGGRISKVQGKVITLDRSLTIAIDDLLIINGNDGISQKRKVINVNDKVITVATVYDNIEAGAIYAVRAKDLDTMKFRVMSIKPDDNNVFSVSAIQYEPLKYDAIDFGADVKPTAISILKPTRVSAPDNVSISATYKVVQGQTVATMVIQWLQVKEAVSYRVEWRKDNGNWIKAPVTGNVSLEVTGVYAGNYLARVVAVDAFDVSSLATTSTLTEIKGKVGAPKALANLKAVGILFGMDLSWNFLAGSEDTAYTELETATDATGANTALLGQFSYPTNKHTITGLQGGLTVYYRGRIVDKLGNVGAWSNWVKGITDNSADKLLTQLEGQITEQQLFKDLGDKIGLIGTNKTEIDLEMAEVNTAINKAKTDILTAKTDITAANDKATTALANANTNKIDLVAVNEAVANNKTAVDLKITTLTNKDISLTNLYTALNSEYGINKAKVVQDLKTLTDKDISLTSLLTALDSDYKGNKSSVATSLTTLTNKDVALTNSINSLTSTVGKNTTAISTEATTRSNADSALSNRITTAQSKADSAFSKITTAETTIASNTQSIAETKTELNSKFEVKDTRDDNKNPQFYMDNYPSSEVKEFKNRANMGVPSNDNYIYVVTSIKYRDFTGGAIVQTAYDNSGIIHIRSSVTPTVWSGWVKQEDVLGSAAKVAAAKAALDGRINTTNANVSSLSTTVANNTTAIATTTTNLRAEFKSGLDNINVGGKNLLEASEITISTSAYRMRDYIITETLKAGEIVTVTVWGTLGKGKLNFAAYNSGSSNGNRLTEVAPNVHSASFPWTVDGSNTFLRIYHMDSSPEVSSTLTRVKLERGNKGTDWTPSPEDNTAAISVESTARANAVSSLAKQVNTLQTKTEKNTTLSHFDMRLDWSQWTNYAGSGETNTSPNYGLIIGNNSGNDQQWLIRDENIPVLSGTVYRVTVRYWNRYGTGRTYIGVAGVASDGTTLVNNSGDNNYGSQVYVGIDSSVGGWSEMTGLFAASDTDVKGLSNVSRLHANAKYFRPLLIANYSNEKGTTYFDYFKVETIDSISTASIEDTKTSVNGLSAAWTMKLDVNGYVSGVGQYNNGTTSQFAVRADQFYIADPNSKTASTPFQVTGGKTVIKDAYIRDGSIDNAKIGKLAVDTAQIANGAIETAKIGKAQVDTLQIKGEAIIVPRVQFTEDDFSFRTIDTEEVINTITLDSDGGGVSISFGFEKIYAKAGGNNTGQSGKVNVRIKRGTKVLRTLSFSMNGVDKHPQYPQFDRWTLTERFITLPTILDTPPKGNQTYTVTLESRGLNSGKSTKDLADHPVVITARSFHIMGAKR